MTQVQHAARVKVDEKGCEAAAFTAVTADAQSAAPEDLPVVEMDLNRPFAFMITGVDGLPLFLGTCEYIEVICHAVGEMPHCHGTARGKGGRSLT